MSQYDPLNRFLSAYPGRRVTLTFDAVERILGRSLPASARTYQAWWANEKADTTRHVHSRAWVTAGWEAHPRLTSSTVNFEKVA
jgi:hypothetical protein